MKITLLDGDCLDHLKVMADSSVDAVVTDPPSGISFMSMDWDCFRRRHNPNDVGRDNVFGRTSATAPHSYGESDRGRFIEFLRVIMTECLRVLKPGGHALVWALPRTSHWTATAIEDAGFEIRDVIIHLQAQGMAKGLNVSKAIDKHLGKQGEVIGPNPADRPYCHTTGETSTGWKSPPRPPKRGPVTEEAKRWEGYGTALAPKQENWILARKPLSESTVAANVLKWGTGALNVDGCRVGRTKDAPASPSRTAGTSISGSVDGSLRRETGQEDGHNPNIGRWPPNVAISHHPDCKRIGTAKVKGSRIDKPCPDPDIPGHKWGTIQGNRGPRGHGDPDGTETVEEWECVEGCPVRELDRQSGITKSTGGEPASGEQNRYGIYGSRRRERTGRGVGKGDSGGASRYYYRPKASRSEREAGLIHNLPCVKCGGIDTKTHKVGDREQKCIRNPHPTVKSVGLMRWLIRLITPPGGTVLDPFCGSGTTLVAAVEEGFDATGIDQDPGYMNVAYFRIRHALEQANLAPNESLHRPGTLLDL